MPVTLGAKGLHGFDQPLELLNDCHRRIENFLGILLEVIGQAGGKPLNDEQHRAVESALTYFQTAAPRHTLDEEESLFPLFRASGDPRARAAMAAVESLEHDHAAANPIHARVELLYRRWIECGSLIVTQRQELSRILHQLREMYRKHIGVEDREIFPLAAKVLSQRQLAHIGKEMAERRGLHGVQKSHHSTAGVIEMSTKSTIDVRTIPGPQRHPLIFRTFETLQPGEGLEIVNDHDPFPLHNQFNSMKRDQFSWDYLQQGPEVWRVRIGKVQRAPDAIP